MSQPPDPNDEIEGFLRRAEREFGPRRSAADEPGGPPAPRPIGPPPGSLEPGPGPGAPTARPPTTPAAQLSRGLLWAIGIIYLLSCAISGSLFQPSLSTLLLLGAKQNSLIAAGEYWRLLTATFLHANLVHILFNGYALYALGPESERIYGQRRFLALYLLSGLGGSIASYALSPAPAVGASGAIFGLIGGLGIFFYLSRKALGEFGQAQVRGIVAIAMINLMIGFAAQGTIDNWGHLGGLAAGTLAGIALAPRLTIDDRLYPPRFVRRHLPQGWAWALAIALLLLLAAVLLPPAG